MARIPMKVVARHELAEQVICLDLTAHDGRELSPWTAGAHIDLAFSPNQLRQYSLCGDPADRHVYRIAILRQDLQEGGTGGSLHIHDNFHAGDLVEIDGPRNHFELVSAARYIFIAGGIGITPILPMIDAAIASGAEWQCVYGGRTKASMAFKEEVLAKGKGAQLWPQDEKGLIDLDALLCKVSADILIYCCGPEPLLQAVTAKCVQFGWPAASLHLERFSAKPVEPGTVDTAFEVMLAKSGLLLQVPADKSLVDVLDAAGIPIAVSCGSGACGTCETTVLEGVPDHRDAILSDEERASCQMMMVCVSRAKSARLVLDL